MTTRPDLPPRRDVEAWLRARVRKPKVGRLARWLGEAPDYAYELGPLIPIDTGVCERHAVFRVHGERGLLPLPALPRGSFGVFAFDGRELCLLAPNDGSFERLLRSEGRPLELADAAAFAQFVCDVRLFEAGCRHVVLGSSGELEAPPQDSPFARYRLDRAEFERVRASIEAPRIAARENGWTLQFTSIRGCMAGLHELALRRVEFSADYSVALGDVGLLSRRIFSTIAPAIP